jgi:carboxyl-terminal processing protease
LIKLITILFTVFTATLVGDRTTGCFSDVYNFKLPNGWKFTLSAEKYYSPTMVNYERIGVPPDHLILNTRAESVKGKDAVLAKALELLLSN